MNDRIKKMLPSSGSTGRRGDSCQEGYAKGYNSDAGERAALYFSDLRKELESSRPAFVRIGTLRALCSSSSSRRTCFRALLWALLVPPVARLACIIVGLPLRATGEPGPGGIGVVHRLTTGVDMEQVYTVGRKAHVNLLFLVRGGMHVFLCVRHVEEAFPRSF